MSFHKAHQVTKEIWSNHQTNPKKTERNVSMKMCQGTFLKQGAGFELFFYCWLTDCAGELSSSFCVADVSGYIFSCSDISQNGGWHRDEAPRRYEHLQVCVFVCSCLFWAQHLAVCVHVKRKVSDISADSELWSDFGSLNAHRGLQHIFIVSIHREIVHRAGPHTSSAASF